METKQETMAFRLTKAEADRVREIAKARDVRSSEVLRLAVQQFIAQA